MANVVVGSISYDEFVLILQNLSGHFSGPVKHPENFDRLASHPVGNKVRRAADYQLAGAGNPSRPARGRMGTKFLDACDDTFHYSRRRFRIVTRDVLGRLIEVLKRTRKPPNLHRVSTSS